MTIDSCDHGDYIVCYETGFKGCPICDQQFDAEAEIACLKAKITSLESDLDGVTEELQEAKD